MTDEVSTALEGWLDARRTEGEAFAGLLRALTAGAPAVRAAAAAAPAEVTPDFYRPSEMPALLGVSRATYYRIVADGLLPWTRRRRGGGKIHLHEHIEQYRENLKAQTKGGR